MKKIREAIMPDIWQPIATAPKDGTIILVYHVDDRDGENLYSALGMDQCYTMTGWYRASWGGYVPPSIHEESGYPDWWHLDDPGETWEYPLNPTHWMPLPPAPTEEA